MPKRNGMAPVDVVRNAYASKRRKLVVDEWDGLEMYFGPLTVEDMESIEKRVKEPDSKYERNVLLLIEKARDKEHKPLFHRGDKQVLMREADLTVLQKIVTFMWEGVPSLEGAQEEVEGNPTSDSD